MPATIEDRQRRRDAILRILENSAVSRQSELVALLRERGIEATQSSVSRDLQELGITKLGDNYGRPESVDAADAASDLGLIVDFVRGIKTAGPSLTVINTAIGAAQRVAVCLDRSGWPEIVGTLSGDDTIFVATRNGQEQRRLVSRLRNNLAA